MLNQDNGVPRDGRSRRRCCRLTIAEIKKTASAVQACIFCARENKINPPEEGKRAERRRDICRSSSRVAAILFFLPVAGGETRMCGIVRRPRNEG